jgi:hypothetical protein
MPAGEESDGIKMDAPPDLLSKEHETESDSESDTPMADILRLQDEIKQRDDRIAQLTAMCYTLARRLRNESFSDNITAVQRQQMAEMAMQSLQMTPAVWDLVHKSEQTQQEPSS